MVSIERSKGLLPRREGYPSKRVDLSWRAKYSPGLQGNFTGRVTLHPAGQLSAQLHSKDLETIIKLTRRGGLTLPGVFTMVKAIPPARVTLGTQIE